jgi:hypothetical protein
MRLLPNGRGVELPDELRCLTLDGLHLKPRQQNCRVHRWKQARFHGKAVTCEGVSQD